jgi:hypothetical protein
MLRAISESKLSNGNPLKMIPGLPIVQDVGRLDAGLSHPPSALDHRDRTPWLAYNRCHPGLLRRR